MAYLERFSTEQQSILRRDPRQYVANLWRHPNRPEDRYDFYDTHRENKLNYLLHDDGPLNPENWGNVNILLFCRGGLKSTTLRMISNWAHHMYLPWGLDTYMTAPREGQVTNFTQPLSKNFDESGLVRFRDKDNQMHQMFEIRREDDETGETYPVQSSFLADSGWGDGDALRGPHTHFGIIDEVQDISKEAFDTYLQCIDQEIPEVSYFPTVFLIGTPKLTGSFYHELWEKTDQKSWDASECEWVAESSPTEYLPDEDVIEEMGVDPDDIEPYEIRGWHLDQYNSPTHDPRAIARDRANSSERKFTNENLAQFYSPEDNLLNTEHVKACFDSEKGFFDRRRHDESFVSLTADWGGGHDRKAADTVFVAAEHTESEDGTIDTTVLNIKFLEEGKKRVDIVRDYEEWLIQYDVDMGLVDYGHDEGFVEDIQDGNHTLDESGYVDTVKAAKFGNVKNKTDVKWETDSGNRRFFTCDKTRSSVRMVDAIKQGRYTIPSADFDLTNENGDGLRLVNQLTAPFKDMTTTPSGSKKIRISKSDSRNDDAFDAFVYTTLAHEVGNVEKVTSFSVNRHPAYS